MHCCILNNTELPNLSRGGTSRLNYEFNNKALDCVECIYTAIWSDYKAMHKFKLEQPLPFPDLVSYLLFSVSVLRKWQTSVIWCRRFSMIRRWRFINLHSRQSTCKLRKSLCTRWVVLKVITWRIKSSRCSWKNFVDIIPFLILTEGDNPVARHLAYLSEWKMTNHLFARFCMVMMVQRIGTAESHSEN